MRRTPVVRWLALATAMFALALPAGAADLGDYVSIHGFGNWSYGETDGNQYLGYTNDGSYDNGNFALNITANPTDRLSIVAQMRFESVNGDDEVELDYGFAGWTFNDALQLRAGRVKHPFGVYGEIFDVGTLRPLFTLPQSIYGRHGFTARAYNGLGLTGFFDWDSGWGLQYDVYGGQIEGDFQIPGLLSTAPDLFLVPVLNLSFEVNDTIGGRLTVTTPVNGLSFGASAYVGEEQINLDFIDPVDRTVYLFSTEYIGNSLSVRAEWGDFENKDNFTQQAWYLEAGYMITDHWQVAARYDDYDLEFPNTDLGTLPPFFPQLMAHEEVTVGVSYWFTPGFVLRLNYSQADGNRLAFVESSEEIARILAGVDELENETDTIIFGAQFSF